MLHILFHSPFKIDVQTMRLMLFPNDTLIALQDGVLIALKNVEILEKNIQNSCKLYLLKEDVLARGLLNNISSNFICINYTQFIVLTQKYSKYINW
ncbi:sulfurtransferase complex subunit TusB [Buchnera aphidicola]|uniref:sulfurtransferase complex subunit TusB n=1 Tax=Buchnera aphidicola TaxID=9 RepID=UPI003463BE69